MCYKCGEKYTSSHKCTVPPTDVPPAQFHAIVSDIGDGGGILCDAILDVLETGHVFPNEQDGFISLNAITGNVTHNAVQLRALVGNQVVLILVDSGSSHTFLIPTCSLELSYLQRVYHH